MVLGWSISLKFDSTARVSIPSFKNSEHVFSLGHAKVVGDNAFTGAKEPKGKRIVGHLDVLVGSILASMGQGSNGSNGNGLGIINLLNRFGPINVTNREMEWKVQQH